MHRIQLQLIDGDVRHVENVACLLVGRRCLLKQVVTDETGQRFVRRPRHFIYHPYPFEVLHAPRYRWPTVLSVDFRSHNKTTLTQFFNIQMSLSYALRVGPKVGSICILPLSARNPEYVALGTVYALWATTCCRTDSELGYTWHRSSEPEYKIVSDVGVDPYVAALDNGCERMWDFIESVLRRDDLGPWPNVLPHIECSPDSTPRAQLIELKRRNIGFDVNRTSV